MRHLNAVPIDRLLTYSSTASITGYQSSVTFGSSPTTMQEVINIAAPGPKGKTINATNMSSTEGFDEFIAAMVDGGECSVEVNYIAAAYAALYALWRTTIAWTITLPDGSTWGFQGIMTGLTTPKINSDDKITNIVTVKVTGMPTFTPPG